MAHCRAVALDSTLFLDDSANPPCMLVRLPFVMVEVVAEQLGVHQGYEAFKRAIERRIFNGEYIGAPSPLALQCARNVLSAEGVHLLTWKPLLPGPSMGR